MEQVTKTGSLLETASTMYSFNSFAMSYVNRVNSCFKFSESCMDPTLEKDSRGNPYKTCVVVVKEEDMNQKAVLGFIKATNTLIGDKSKVISWRLVPYCSYSKEKKTYTMSSSFTVI